MQSCIRCKGEFPETQLLLVATGHICRMCEANTAVSNEVGKDIIFGIIGGPVLAGSAFLFLLTGCGLPFALIFGFSATIAGLFAARGAWQYSHPDQYEVSSSVSPSVLLMLAISGAIGLLGGLGVLGLSGAVILLALIN